MTASADRRPVDPPPVVKLRVMQDKVDVTGHYEANFLLFASLEFSRPIAHGNIYATQHCPVLTGTNVAGAAYLTKPTNAAYFIFPDLSVRHEGFYRLKFHLFEQIKGKEDFDPIPIASGTGIVSPNNPQDDMINRTFVYTPPFQVFSAKKFPGLEQSTNLSRDLAEQGCRVRIRREIRQRKCDSKPGKKEDDQRSLRAISHDRIASLDSQDQWNRQAVPSDTRRPSIESQLSYGPSRHHSYAPSALPSPSTAGPQYAPHTPYASHDARMQSGPISAEPEELWQPEYRNTNMPPAHSPRDLRQPLPPMAPPIQRRSYAAISPAQPTPDNSTTRLPPITDIASIMNPIEPSHPAGRRYDIPEPVQKKRTMGRSDEDRSAALKDGARPSPIRSPPKSMLSWAAAYGAGTSGRAPLVPLDQAIEADESENDDEKDDGNGSDSGDSITGSGWENRGYMRADGKRSTAALRRVLERP